MAFKHHKSSVCAILLMGILAGISSDVRAQNLPNNRAQATLGVQAFASHTASAQPGVKSGDELVLSATPEFSVYSRGAHTAIDTQWQFNFLDYAHNTQPDRVLPNGKLNLHVFASKGGPGIDLSVEASQVKSTASATTSVTPDTRNSYTNATYRISPYIERDLNNQTQVSARIERQLLHTTQLSSTLAPRPDTLSRNENFKLIRRPTPLGYGLEWHQQETRVSGTTAPSLDERINKASALYAPAADITLGLSVGRGHNLIGTQTVTETTHGWQAQWRPSERSMLKGEVEDRHFGRSWLTEISHRSPWLALGLNSERSVTTYAATTGNNNTALRGMYDALLTTRIPDPAERRQAVDDMIARRNLASQATPAGDTYDVAAQVRQATTGRVALMGRRDIVSFVGGLVRTSPLASPNETDPALSGATGPGLGASTKQYYLDTQLNHQLTPSSTISTGLRWSRVWTTQPGAAEPVLSRDFSWRAAFNTTLTAQTTASMGFNRQITHNPSTTTSDESAMFVGLGHRF
jgi:uncharacterized protein (PEP-CTERM system associated)